ncbi:hypothetical protein LXA43DRAFT_1065530 [Ganoderma leucocontextum]|nr:hypothetical protein LXA43DRAFT_1065530 [Ganoderma leucocontextum]
MSYGRENPPSMRSPRHNSNDDSMQMDWEPTEGAIPQCGVNGTMEEHSTTAGFQQQLDHIQGNVANLHQVVQAHQQSIDARFVTLSQSLRDLTHQRAREPSGSPRQGRRTKDSGGNYLRGVPMPKPYRYDWTTTPTSLYNICVETAFGFDFWASRIEGIWRIGRNAGSLKEILL